MSWPVDVTQFLDGGFNWSMYEKDFLYTPDGNREIPDHHCKQTFVKSLPYIKSFRNSIDIGCRDGEYTRYLHKYFNHVYCFDYRKRKLFNKNVDLTKVSHFQCALGNCNEEILVSGAGSLLSQSVPKDQWIKIQLYTLDQFEFENIDYIKIDVDGFELKVLQGAINTIEKFSPILVLEQENNDTEALEFCKGLGYSIADWDDQHRNVIMRKL
jgi:FkbM family methyltransferase